MPSEIEERFDRQLKAAKGMPPWVREYHFAHDVLMPQYPGAPRPNQRRGYRMDFAWPERMILVEIQGSTWMGKKGRHTTGAGVDTDTAKLNLATIMGYRTFVFTSSDVNSLWAVEMMRGLLVDRCQPQDWSKPRRYAEVKKYIDALRQHRMKRWLEAGGADS